MHNKRSRDILSILANPVVLIKKRVRSRMLEPYKDCAKLHGKRRA